MYKKFFTSLLMILLFNTNIFASLGGVEPTKKVVWPFAGMFGSVDRQSAQRGAQIFLEVCSACHSAKHLYYRNLQEIGFSIAEIKEIANDKTVIDGPNDDGEMFERAALPSDNIVAPYPNEEAARAANNGAYPADLSLIVKSRLDGANHLFSILTGYQDPPGDMKLMPGLHYNPYFEGKQIAMPPPIVDDQVEFMDGTKATVDQMSKDVTVFLQWASEPEMEHRKSLGLKVMMFLSIFTLLFFIAKKRLWKNI